MTGYNYISRRILYAVLFCLISSYCLSAELWFPVGEQLFHKIYWGFIPVGKSVTTTRMIEREGKQYVQIRIRTRTNSFFDSIRKVDDIVESIVDPATFLPISFSRKMIRRKETCYEHTVFDREQQQGIWQNLCTGEMKIFSLDKDTKDILAFLYFIRQARFEENSESKYRVMADEGMFDLKLDVGETTDVDLPIYGDVKSLRIDPIFDFDGLLVNGGKFHLWVSKDDRRLLTKGRIKRKLADINIELFMVSGPGKDQWTRIPSEKGYQTTVLTDDEIESYLEGDEPLDSDEFIQKAKL